MEVYLRCTKAGNKLDILLVYWLHCFTADFLTELAKFVSEVVLRMARFIVLGDFNIHSKVICAELEQDFMVSM